MKTLEYYRTRKRRAKTNAYKLMLDTPESNYWLGYLLADGWFSLNGRIAFAQSGRDKQAVLDFAKFINFQGRIGIQERDHKLTVKFTDTELCRDYCQKWGIPRGTKSGQNTKTYNPPDFYHIKDKLTCYKSFLCGLVSGDGSVYEAGGCYIEMHKNWLGFLKDINSDAVLKKRKIKGKSRSTDPWSAFCYIGVDETQDIYQTAIANNIPLGQQKWSPVPTRTTKIEQKTVGFDNRRVEIQDLVAAGWLQKDIGKKFDISQQHVSDILRGKRR